MRFVSKFKKYMICFQAELVEHYATGQSRTIQPLLNCEFDNYGSLYQYEMDAAMAHWRINTQDGFSGMTTEVDEVTLTDPRFRLSVFDSDQFAKAKGLSAEKKRELEEFLVSRDEHGRDYIQVVKPAVVAPWPRYDDVKGVKGKPTADKIAETVVELGLDPDAVIEYERSNRDRDEVVAALEALKTPEPDDEPLVAA